MWAISRIVLGLGHAARLKRNIRQTPLRGMEQKLLCTRDWSKNSLGLSLGWTMAWHRRSLVNRWTESQRVLTSISHSGLIAWVRKIKTESILARFHSVGGHSTLVIGPGHIICTRWYSCKAAHRHPISFWRGSLPALVNNIVLSGDRKLIHKLPTRHKIARRTWTVRWLLYSRVDRYPQSVGIFHAALASCSGLRRSQAYAKPLDATRVHEQLFSAS